MDQTKIAVNVFDKVAELYQDKFMDVSLYHESLDLYCDNLPENAAVLEVACGPGNLTKYLLEKRSDLKILATDLAPKMIELGKANNPIATFQLLDVKKIKKLGQKFDAVVNGFGLPYLSKKETLQFIADAAHVLNKDGMLYISTMEDDNSNSKYVKGSTGDEVFMNYHEADYLTKTIEQDGFKIISIDRKEYLYNEEKTTDLIIIAIKK